MVQLRFSLFGTPELRRCEQILTFPTRKALALLVYLAVEGNMHTRPKLVGLLWPDSDPTRGRAVLRRTLVTLREVLDEEAPAVLTIGQDVLGVNPASLELDTTLIQTAWTLATGSLPPAEHLEQHKELLQQAIRAYRGDFLDGYNLSDAPDFDEWLSHQRGLWHQRLSTIYDYLSQLLARTMDIPTAIEINRLWIAHDPLNEEPYRRLMQAHFAASDRVAALRVYNECYQMTTREFNASPDPQTETLAHYIRTNRVMSGTTVIVESRNPTASTATNTILKPNSPLVGREEELFQITDYLYQAKSSLLTITGPGGVGKTRLAMQAAANLAAVFEQVVVVPLATVHDPALVMPAIARCLNVGVDEPISLGQSLHLQLGQSRLLLVLDNFEQVVEAASQLDILLTECPSLSILVTSQASLHLSKEFTLLLKPLSLPDSSQILKPETLRNSPAVNLFVQHIQAIKPGFDLTEANAAAVAAICIKLDGLPLSLELAAARLKILTPQDLLSRLSDRFAMLTKSNRDVPLRQQNLRGTLEWSYSLLNEEEKQIFAQLGAFAGSCTLKAAEAVCEGMNSPVLEVLESLVDKSLIYWENYSEDEIRINLLQTIQVFALELLEARSDKQRVFQRRATYYTDFVLAAQPHIRQSGHSEWARRLEYEQANIRATLQWMLDYNEVATAATIANALWQYWAQHGDYSEGRSWLSAILERASDLPDFVRMELLMGAANLARGQSDFIRATILYEQVLELARSAQNIFFVARTLNSLGSIANDMGDETRAVSLLQESLNLSQQAGDARLLAGVLNNLGLANKALGNFEQANVLHTESLTIFQEIGDRHGVATSLNNIGYVALAQTNYTRAITFFNDALRVAEELNSTRAIINILNNLGKAETGQGNFSLATNTYQRSLSLCAAIGIRQETAECLEGLAVLVGAQSEPHRSVKLFSAAQAIRNSIKAPLPADERPGYTESMERIRRQLSPVVWEALWAEGQKLTFGQVIMYGIQP